jgi:hypothetical protein
MSGRYRALLLAVATSGSLLFAWIGAAVVGLVTLRKGAREGSWLLLWALLPALLLTRVSGDSSALALLLGTAVLALTLRGTVNLPLTALCSSAVAIATAVSLLFWGQDLLAELARVFEEFFRALAEQAQRDGAETLQLRPPTVLQLAGMMGTANGALSFLCLALARYWQSELYHPGGFGQEFRALRFPPTLVGGLLVAAAALAALGISYRSWAAALLLPLTIAGFALLHARARQRGQGSLWLTALYMLWLVFDVAKLLLLGLVVADAMVDFRSRWGGAAAAGNGAEEGADASAETGAEDDAQPPAEAPGEDSERDRRRGGDEDGKDE